MCKTSSWRLELRPLPPHPTSTYTCRVTITPRVCGGHSYNQKWAKIVQLQLITSIYCKIITKIIHINSVRTFCFRCSLSVFTAWYLIKFHCCCKKRKRKRKGVAQLSIVKGFSFKYFFVNIFPLFHLNFILLILLLFFIYTSLRRREMNEMEKIILKYCFYDLVWEF